MTNDAYIEIPARDLKDEDRPSVPAHIRVDESALYVDVHLPDGQLVGFAVPWDGIYRLLDIAEAQGDALSVHQPTPGKELLN